MTVGEKARAGSAIHLRGIEKRYDVPGAIVTALSPVDLEIKAGEFVVLLGPSGCGKTTLLRMIAGFIRPTAGILEIESAEGSRTQGTAGRIGVVFQDANLFPWYTIEENIALPLRVHRVARAERLRKARELCALVGLTGFEHRRPRELSGGMRQRAAIARALISDPDILLLDEPFGALDAMTRDQLNVEIQRIWLTTRCTVVLVTHSISEAVFLGDRVVSLSARPGKIEEVTTVPHARPRGLEVQADPGFQSIVQALRRLLGHAA